MIASTQDVLTSPPPPTPIQLDQITSGDQQACRDLIDSWEQPIKTIASAYTSRPSDIDDLIQVGRLAVYHSALNYDPAFDVPFGNYTKRGIKNSVMQESARLARQRRFELSLEGYDDENDAASGEHLDESDQIHSVKAWVLELPEPHATIFRLLYVQGMKQRPAAKEMGVSQPRVAQLHRTFIGLGQKVLAG